jgi:mutator protein MutT
MKKRVRAVIIKDNKILLIKRTRPDMVYWATPGGAVESDETNEQALVRECQEELGVTVKVNNMILEMDSQKPETKGEKEFFYLCEITGGKVGSGHGPEFKKNTTYVGRYDIEWVKIKDLKKIDLRPADIKNLILNRYQ